MTSRLYHLVARSRLLVPPNSLFLSLFLVVFIPPRVGGCHTPRTAPPAPFPRGVLDSVSPDRHDCRWVRKTSSPTYYRRLTTSTDRESNYCGRVAVRVESVGNHGERQSSRGKEDGRRALFESTVISTSGQRRAPRAQV